MATKLTLIFQVTTNPPDLSSAIPHTGGWSESWWDPVNIVSSANDIRALAQARAQLLPTQAKITGFRLGYYTLSQNKILPQGSAAAKLNYPGASGLGTDLPQVALSMSGTTAGGPNKSAFKLLCMPDDVMQGGEYAPSSAFKGKMTGFCNSLVSGGWHFLGRDLAQAASRVLRITGTTIQLDGLLPGGAVGDYIRLNRVYDVNGNSIQGVFRIVTFAGPTYTVAGLPAGIDVGESGTARLDKLKLFQFASVIPGRAGIRKIGRPSEGYRGRQTKR